MITKAQLAGALTRECDIAVHLYSKLTPEAWSYRPSEGQRATLDLLRYLAACGIGGLESLAGNDFRAFGKYVERVKDMTADEFPDQMALQKAEIEEFFAATTEQTLTTQEAKMPGGGPLPLAAAIINGPLKWLTAYKMQLFLYAKASGAQGIGTSNAWGGFDMPPAKTEAAG